MQRFFYRLKNFTTLVMHLQWKEIGKKIWNRLFSSTYYYGLVNRLEEIPDFVAKPFPTRLRLLRAGDAGILFDLHAPGLSHAEISDRLYEHLLIDSGIRTCYVAVTGRGEPCAALWLIAATENQKLRHITNGNFPPLADDEMLLEGLFTLQAFRNMHIMASSIVQSLSEAKSSGATKVIAFVQHQNSVSLNTLDRCGFVRYVVKRERWFLFFRRSALEALPARGDGVLRVNPVRARRSPDAATTVDQTNPSPIFVHRTRMKEGTQP